MQVKKSIQPILKCSPTVLVALTALCLVFSTTSPARSQSFPPIPHPVTPSSTVSLTALLNGDITGSHSTLSVSGVGNAANFELTGVDIHVSNGRVQEIDVESGSFTFVGLTVSINDVVFNTSDNSMTAESEIDIPVEPNNPLSVDVDFVVDSGGVSIKGGEIDLPDFTLGNMGVSNAFLAYDDDENTLSSGADVAIPGLGEDPENPAEIDGLIVIKNGKIDLFHVTASGLHIPIGDTGANLTEIGVGAGNLTNPSHISLSGDLGFGVGSPGGIDVVSADVHGKVQPANGYIDVSGNVILLDEINVGGVSMNYRPRLSLGAGAYMRYPSKSFDIIYGDLSFHIGSFVEYVIRNNSRLNVRKSLGLYNCFYNGLSSPGCKPLFSTNVPPYDTVVSEARKWDYNFWGDVDGGLKIPDSVDVIGGYTLASVSGHINPHRFHASASIDVLFDTVHFSLTITSSGWDFDVSELYNPETPWLTPYNQPYYISPKGDIRPLALGETPPTDGMFLQPLTNFQLVDFYSTTESNTAVAPLQAEDNPSTISIPSNETVMILINYENAEASQVDLVLTAPDGTAFPFAEGLGEEGFGSEIGGTLFNPGRQEALYVFNQPAAGEYQLTVNNAAELGNYSAQVIVPDQPPQGNYLQVTETDTPYEYEVAWDASDAEENPIVEFSLDTDRQGGDGIPIFVTRTDEEGNNPFTFNTESLRGLIPAGEYYVMMRVRDTSNAPVSLYSDERIVTVPSEFIDASGTDSVQVDLVKIRPEQGGFTVAWEPIPDPTIAGYTVEYTQDPDLGRFEFSQYVDGNETAQATILDVPLGHAYYVTVVATSTSLQRSQPSEVVRVVPLGATDEIRNPVAKKYLAEAGQPFVYDQLVNHHFKQAHGEQTDTFEWRFINAPEGMTIEPGSEIITWTPTAQQTGVHLVALEYTHTHDNGETTRVVHEFEVEVFADKLSGHENLDHFVSSPNLVAEENTTYEYAIQLSNLNQIATVELLEGPPGMTLQPGDLPSQWLLQWNVPDNAEGQTVRLQATTASGYTFEQSFFLFVNTDENTLIDTAVQNPWIHQANP